MEVQQLNNEIQLSNDLNTITAEINNYKQVAGQAIFEIGKRLKHVKENDLVHGEWINWLESIQMDRSEAHRFIQVTEKLGIENVETFQHMGLSALNLIATLPQEEREKEHTLKSGDTKTPDEMTVRELQEVKKQLKEKDEQLKQAQKSEEIALRQLEELESQEPKVIEKEIVKKIIPNDYEQTKIELEALEKRIKIMESTQQDISAKEKEVKLLNLDASKSVLKTKIKIDDFLQDVAVTSYRRGAIATSSEGTKNKLREGLDDLKNFIKEMELALDGTIEQQV